jgi:hypothetical protein
LGLQAPDLPVAQTLMSGYNTFWYFPGSLKCSKYQKYESNSKHLKKDFEDVQKTRRGYKLASWRYFSRPRLAVFDKTFTWQPDLTCDLQRGNLSHSNVESWNFHWKCCDASISLPPCTPSKILILTFSICSTSFAHVFFTKTFQEDRPVPQEAPMFCSLRSFISSTNQISDLHEPRDQPQPAIRAPALLDLTPPTTTLSLKRP